MPIGLANAPGIFKELMSIVMHGLGDFAMVYLDDIIIFNASEEDDKQCIQTFLSGQQHLKLKLSKCKFMQRETQYHN